MVPKVPSLMADGSEAAVGKEPCIRRMPRSRLLPASVAGCPRRNEAGDVLLLEALAAASEGNELLVLAALAVTWAAALA